MGQTDTTSSALAQWQDEIHTLFLTRMLLMAALLVLPFCISAPAAALNVTTHISDQSTQVVPTQRLYFDVSIKYPENTSRKDLRITAELRQDNRIIATSKNLHAVETQTSFLDYIVVPENAKRGDATLAVIVEDYAGSHQEASATFQVIGSDPDKESFGILFATIIAIGIAVSIQILWLHRRR